MDAFKNDLLKVCKTNIIAPIILGVLVVIMVALGVLTGGTDYKEFNPDRSGYSQMKVTYVMGPFAEQTLNGSTSDQYYIAETEDGYWYVISTGAHNKLPVYGEDVYDEDIDSLTPVTIKGKSTHIQSEMVPYLVDFFSDTDIGMTNYNYSDFLGSYYLDTTQKANGGNIVFFVVAAIILFILVLVMVVSGRKTKAVKNKIAMLEQSGDIQELFQDFCASQPFFSSRLKLGIGTHFILDYSVPKDGFAVLPLEGINNVFKCNMINGNPTSTSYIALETTEGKRYCIAPCNGKSEDFDKAINKLKSITCGGSQW